MISTRFNSRQDELMTGLGWSVTNYPGQDCYYLFPNRNLRYPGPGDHQIELSWSMIDPHKRLPLNPLGSWRLYAECSYLYLLNRLAEWQEIFLSEDMRIGPVIILTDIDKTITKAP